MLPRFAAESAAAASPEFASGGGSAAVEARPGFASRVTTQAGAAASNTARKGVPASRRVMASRAASCPDTGGVRTPRTSS